MQKGAVTAGMRHRADDQQPAQRVLREEDLREPAEVRTRCGKYQSHAGGIYVPLGGARAAAD